MTPGPAYGRAKPARRSGNGDAYASARRGGQRYDGVPCPCGGDRDREKRPKGPAQAVRTAPPVAHGERLNRIGMRSNVILAKSDRSRYMCAKVCKTYDRHISASGVVRRTRECV